VLGTLEYVYEATNPCAFPRRAAERPEEFEEARDSSKPPSSSRAAIGDPGSSIRGPDWKSPKAAAGLRASFRNPTFHAEGSRRLQTR